LNEPNAGLVDIEIPSEFLIKNYINLIQAIISTTYPQIMEKFKDEMFLISRAILANQIKIVDKINKYVLYSIPSDASFIIIIYTYICIN